MNFFTHYGSKLNQKETGLAIRSGGFLFGKSYDDVLNGRCGHNRLVVESPLNWVEDVGSGAYNYNIARKHFRVAQDILLVYAPY